MIEPKDIIIKAEKEEKGFGRFVIEPLPSGYGYTLGNALRRVLLSSLPGAAIAEVSFSGVSHPFTTIKGVKEDVVELILNLKKVRFIMHTDEPLEATLEAKGKKVVTAGDISISSEAKVVNPELVLATLTDKSSKLSARLLVEKGVGYKAAEEREATKVGVIPMDSVFTPVTRVSYHVEEARRGRETNLDRLVLEITTDTTIKPSEALEKAAGILVSFLERFTGAKQPQEDQKEVLPSEEKEEKEEPSSKVRKKALSDLGLSTQTVTVLTKAGIKTVGGLITKSEGDLLAIKGFGGKRITEVKRELQKLGVSLKGE